MKLKKAALMRFAKEVNVTKDELKKIKKELNEIEKKKIAQLVISKISPKKGYSNKFIMWFDELPEDFF